jgi:hypothetical protein
MEIGKDEASVGRKRKREKEEEKETICELE